MDSSNWVSESLLTSARSLGEACWLASLLGRFTFWWPIERTFGDRLPPSAASSAEKAIVGFLALGAFPMLGSLLPALGRSPAPATFGAFLGGLFGLGFLLSLPLRKPTIPGPALRWMLWALLTGVLLLDPAGRPAVPLGPGCPLLWGMLLRLLLLSLSLWLATLLAELLIFTPILARTGRRDPFVLLLGTGSLVNSYAITLFGSAGLGVIWLFLFHARSSPSGPFTPLLEGVGGFSLFALFLRSFHQVLAEPAATAVLMRPRASRSPTIPPPGAVSAARLPLGTHALELLAVAGALVAGNFLAARPLATPPSPVEFRWIDFLLLPLLALVAAGGHRLFHFSRQLVQACLDLPQTEDAARVPPVLVLLGWRQWLWAGGIFTLSAATILGVAARLH